ncbi:MAG: translational GTPase TypA [Deltaproteobacteria bacterium]|nr:translational GTPase TypA [Deltaproteobacteria bacterium]
MKRREDLYSLAIIAHVDHGKTTLVDALFRQGGLFRDNQVIIERAMDSNDQERERGITILAKCTSVRFGSDTFQIVDTPGHADFGGEVERTLRMIDGVLLLVDAAEGCLPQTRFVLRKSLEQNLPVVVAINKIDRQDARPQEVLNEIYDLFIDLGAHEHQLEFPVLYTNARSGTASLKIDEPGTDLAPLVQAIIKTIPSPEDHSDGPFVMQVNQLAYDDYVGRLVVGRIQSGAVKTNQITHVNTKTREYDTRVTGVYTFQGIKRIPLTEAKCGDIVALSGFDDIAIGDIVADNQATSLPEPIKIDEPTVVMVFQVNDGPLAGKSGGQFVTSRHLRERLYKESYANPSIRVEDGDTPEQFRVFGRGELQLAVLIEAMRREAFELCVRNPEVVTRDGKSGKEEPVERVAIDVPLEYMGAVTELLGPRRAQMIDHRNEGSRTRLEYIIPTRGLFGIRNPMLTATRGTAIMHGVFEGWMPHSGAIPKRIAGALVADRLGIATPYAINNLQSRGAFFISPNTQVYEGMIVGEHIRPNDLDVNVCREKKLTNVRSTGHDENVAIVTARQMPLERCLEWIKDDEMIEVAPEAIRLRKRILAANKRPSTKDKDREREE